MSTRKTEQGTNFTGSKPLSPKSFFALVLSLAVLLGCVYVFVLPRAKELARANAEKSNSASEIPEDSSDWPRVGADYPHNDGTFVNSLDKPRSRLPLEVEAGSYRQIIRMIQANRLPHPGNIRLEQLINYFDYKYPTPTNEATAGISVDAMPCPWNEANHLVRVQMSARQFVAQKRLPRNLVFLVDLSRSMDGRGRLPLLTAAFRKFVDALEPNDRISIIGLASNSEIILNPTSGSNKELIRHTFDNLRAQRGSPVAEGFEIAYNLATTNYLTNYVNRILLCTDGDLDIDSIGTNSVNRAVANYAKNGITLSTFGFGLGNYQNVFLERLADQGGGTHEYINTYPDALRALHQELHGVSPIVARNARLQVDFNTARVSRYRLIGFENPAPEPESARLQTSHLTGRQSLVALYEVTLANQSTTDSAEQLLTLKFFYTPLENDEPMILKAPLFLSMEPKPNPDLQFAAAITGFGMLLQNSPHKGNASFDLVRKLATLGNDGSPERAEFLEAVELTSNLGVSSRF